jgi:hypothetical protein
MRRELWRCIRFRPWRSHVIASSKYFLDIAPPTSTHAHFMLRAWHKLRHFSSMPSKQAIIAIVGSTGTGKSDVHLSLLHLVTPPRLTTAAS